VSGLISALVSTVAAYALIRIVFTVFTVDFLAANEFAQTVLVAGAVVSIVVGSVLAVTQREIKRMLAYSSVSQFGLVVGAIAVANGTALTGAMIHLVGHAIMKGGLFLTSGLIADETDARTIDAYEGLAERTPIGAAAFGVLALGMVGVPPAVGFVGKWYIALGAVEGEAWPLAVVILASTLLTLAYFARILERMFFREATPVSADEASAADANSRSQGQTVVTDGIGPDVVARTTQVSIGMRATVVAAAVLAVLLGVAAFEYGQLLEPTIDRLLA
jgi:multicomponent Na+:H+ antiporter subunit D